jgi:uroporphyrinogen-III synthase
MLRLLITRPQADAERTAAAVRERGHEAVMAPLIALEPLPMPDLSGDRWGGLLVTSANALRAAGEQLRPWLGRPLLAVGDHTAAVARQMGFRDVRSGGGDAARLADLAAATFGPGIKRPLLHLAGADRAADLAALLRPRGIAVETLTVYRMAAAAQFPTAISDRLVAGTIDGVMHFSRRSAETFLRCAERAGLSEIASGSVHYCLSAQVAAPLRAAGATAIRIAADPAECALLDLLPG